LSIPYFFAIHNGAIIVEMPSRKILAKKYLHPGIFQKLDDICKDEPSDYAVYGGYEFDDVCYYRPERYSPETLSYLERRVSGFREKWVEVKSYEELPISNFPSIKCFGKKESAERMAEKISSELQLHAPVIRDPFDDNYYVVQGTHSKVDKGEALLTLKSLISGCDFTIAGGDDLNDVPMLEKANIAIGMQTAPQQVLSIADIIAPPASDLGIIEGLQQALEKTLKKEVS
ncbi:MAG: HAD hydrolase family protein, partial [Chlamydiota bacterium]